MKLGHNGNAAHRPVAGVDHDPCYGNLENPILTIIQCFIPIEDHATDTPRNANTGFHALDAWNCNRLEALLMRTS